MKTGLTHAERKRRTRAGLIETARSVFLESGFYGASLDQIAEAAGYSKGAVYSNFASKADLFLAVLDAHYEQRARAYTDVVLDESDPEDAYRAVARFRIEEQAREPAWEPLFLEFWTYAARRDELREALIERRERFLDLIAGLIDELALRYGITYTISSRDAARGSSALLRGMAIERMLDPSATAGDALEEMHAAYMKGLTKR
jgi:AcrR family transcriptional regulator